MLLQLLLVIIVCAHDTRAATFFQIPRDEGKKIDPEVYMNATELITSKGYPCENHWATTDDGYILNLIRIPHGLNNTQSVKTNKKDKKRKEPRPAIFLQHGIITSATNFLTNLANESLAYILADAGADVWLGNSRGNIYSRNHTTLNPKELKFWDFGWDEMAKYDVPANVNYIRKVTGHNHIFYGGHSQGTTMAFAAFSENQELASTIKHFIALAPVTRIAHAKGPILKLGPIAKYIDKFFDFFGHGAITFPEFVKRFLAVDGCPLDEAVCANVLFLLCGYDTKALNETRIPVYVSHNPAGTSSRDVLQWAQNSLAKQFQKFDYGSKQKNMKYYGQPKPPVYNLTNMKVPVAMYTGSQDWLADPIDVAWLIPQVNVTNHINVDYYNHLDLIWATDAPKMIYQDIIKIVMS